MSVILIDITISSNQSGFRIKNNCSTTGPYIMPLPGDSITIKISADCYKIHILPRSLAT